MGPSVMQQPEHKGKEHKGNGWKEVRTLGTVAETAHMQGGEQEPHEEKEERHGRQ